MSHERDAWTLASLCERARTALEAGSVGQTNGQVRDIPDERTVRYYTTLGLLDRPAAMRGRVALYGRRHLLQIVAIKRLQARGLKLAAIQRELLGIPDRALEKIARLPPGAGAPTGAEERLAFWKARPAAAAREANASGSLRMVELGGGVHVLIENCGPVAGNALERLRAAAQPLLAEIEACRGRGPEGRIDA
jgi:DNA-binding transcriptional MerR regulator